MKHLHATGAGQSNHYVVMFFIMILSGLLSTMNMWVDKYEDVRFSLNDAYMILLMTGWMFCFMGLYYQEMRVLVVGGGGVVGSVVWVRAGWGGCGGQYKLGMIPHHSMAILMSKKLLDKPNNIQPFLKNIIKTQESEILYMKRT